MKQLFTILCFFVFTYQVVAQTNTFPATGNVGIGTTTPATKLHVVGDIMGQNRLLFLENNSFSVTPTTVPTLTSSSFSMPHYGIAGAATTSGGDLWLAGFNAIRMFNGGVPTPVLSVTGQSLGLGTLSPQRRLHISGGYGQVNGLGIGSFGINDYGTTLYTEDYGYGVAHLFALKHGVNYGDVALSEYGGRVGIGTARPLTTLDVRGASRFGNKDFVSATTGSFLEIQQGATSGNTYSEIGAYSAGGSVVNNLILARAGGNIGIGTTTPAVKLHIMGKTRIEGSSTTSDEFGTLHLNSSTIATKRLLMGFDDADNAGFIASVHSGTAWLNTIINKYGGNVGIGTATPTQKLDVTGNLKVSGLIFSGEYGSNTWIRDNASLQGNAGATSGFFQTAYPVNYPKGASGWWHLIDTRHTNAANNFAMQIAGSFYDQKIYVRKTINNPSQPWRELVTTDTLGRLGVGTANPIYKQTIQTVESATPIIALNVNNPFGYGVGKGTSAVGIRFNRTPNDAGSTGVMADIWGGNENESSSTQGYLAFGTRLGSSESTIERMRIASSGNVGIGINNPSQKLEIRGKSGSPATSGSTQNGIVAISSDDTYGTLHVGNNLASPYGMWLQSSGRDNLAINYPLILNQNGGNVGIGTATPTNTLTIDSKVVKKSGLTFANIVDKTVSYAQDKVFPLGVNLSGEVVLNETATVPSLWTATGNNIVNANSGNVGIGTTNPTEKLEISGNAFLNGTSPKLRFNHSNVAAFSTGIFGETQDNSRYSISSSSVGEVFSVKYLNGNVGIGTASNKLTQTLNINGGIGFSNQNNGDKKLFSPVDGDLEWMTHNLAAGHGFAVSHQGTRAIYLNTSGHSYINGGNVGIGTANPATKLEVRGAVRIGNADVQAGGVVGGTGSFLRIGQLKESGNVSSVIDAFQNGGDSYSNLLLQSTNGSVAIGTIDVPTGYKLAVAGDVIAERIVVKLKSAWPDYVFNTGYPLKPLVDVELYLKEHKHLPDVPSEQEVKEKGVDVTQMNAVLLKKIEELTLYMIDLKKQNDELQKRVNAIEQK